MVRCCSLGSIPRAGAAGGFLGGVVRFVIEHLGFGAAAAPAFLAANLFDLGAFGGDETFLTGFNFVEQ